MIWSVFQTVGFTFFFLCSVFFVLKKKYTELLILYFWGIGFACCFQFWITLWTPEKVVCLAMIYCILFHKPRYGIRPIKILSVIVSALILLVFCSDIYVLTMPEGYSLPISPYRRMLLQNFSYITTTVLLLYGPFLKRNFSKKLFPGYCRAVEFAILVGLVHYTFIKMGLEFMPILRATMSESNESTSVVAQFGNSMVTRVYGFAGEPKGLGFFIVPYLILSIVCYLNGWIIKSKSYHIFFFLAGAFVLLQTYSSSALITFILMLPIIIVYGNSKTTRLQNYIAFAAVFFVLMFLLSGLFNDGQSFLESLNERTFERGMTELEDERQETVIFDAFLNDSPNVQIFGWGIGQYTFHVPGQFVGNRIIPVQSGLVLTLADFGLIGILFFLYILLFINGLLRRCAAINAPLVLGFAMCTMTKFVESLMHGALYTSFVFMMIACYMYQDVKLQNKIYGVR